MPLLCSKYWYSLLISSNILLQGSFYLMKLFRMPFRNVRKRISVNGKAKFKKKKRTSLQRQDLVWIKLEVTPKLDSSSNQMKVIQQKDEYLLCRQTVCFQIWRTSQGGAGAFLLSQYDAHKLYFAGLPFCILEKFDCFFCWCYLCVQNACLKITSLFLLYL